MMMFDEKTIQAYREAEPIHEKPNPQTSADLKMAFERAMDKVRDEMAASAGNAAVCAVGEMMTELLQLSSDIVGAVLAEGKTLAGAYQAIHQAAREDTRFKTTDGAVVGPADALRIVRAYYEIEGDEETPGRAPTPAEPDDLDLDALLDL